MNSLSRQIKNKGVSTINVLSCHCLCSCCLRQLGQISDKELMLLAAILAAK